MTRPLAFSHVRISTKERPHDRFLTAQTRALAGQATQEQSGTFFFVVEITNPWFPNSQIGQTVINTIIREYRRGEHSSSLQNFEIALRKTNEVLAHITQSGETDWIGHLMSIIALAQGNHLYIAQTGQARAYLLRAGKIIDLTDGLEDEANSHPLSTYTNITSGTLETGDRLLFGTSLLAESLGEPDLKTILATESLDDASHNLVRALQNQHVRHLNGFVIDVVPAETVSDPVEATLYLDQSLTSPIKTIRRAWSQHVAPATARGGQRLAAAARQGAVWTRDWLVPRLLSWGVKSHSAVRKHSQTLVSGARPLVSKTIARVRSRLPMRLTKPSTPLTVKESGTNVRIHHYSEALAAARRRFRWPKNLKLPQFRLPNWHVRWRLNRRQILTLTLAMIVLVSIIISASSRRTSHVTQQTASTAAAALSAAKTAQQNAERAFILGQKESAKTDYLTAMTAATQALTDGQTAAEAKNIFDQSQTLFDQLINASRVPASVPNFTLLTNPTQLNLVDNRLLVAIKKDLYQADPADTTATKTTSLAIDAAETETGTILSGSWYLADSTGGLWNYNPSSKRVAAATLATGAWKTGPSLASFGSSLYLLDSTAGQIWKYSKNGPNFEPAHAYLNTADPASLKQAVSLAIDGDIFVLNSTGEVLKYTHGTKDSSWAVKNIPSPWAQLTAAQSIFTSPNSDHLFIFEGADRNHPARLIAVTRDGDFTHQLLFPTDWKNPKLAWDPVTKQGFVAVDNLVYRLSWSE